MKTDIQIAQEATMLPIKDVAANYGITEDDLELYGKYKAKFSDEFMNSLDEKPDGKLVLMTAINPTPAGEGKTRLLFVFLFHNGRLPFPQSHLPLLIPHPLCKR